MRAPSSSRDCLEVVWFLPIVLRNRGVVTLAYVHEAHKMGVAGKADKQDLKYRQAMKELLAGAKLDPDNTDIQYLTGLVYFVGFRKHEEAEKHLHRALATRKDDFPEADHLLGTVLVDAGRPEEALPFLDRARSNILYATPYFAEQEIGWAKYRLERYDEAVAHLENAIVAQPNMCGVYTRLADVYEARQDYVSVQRVLENFVTRCDSDRLREHTGDALLAYGYYRLGMSLLKNGDPEKAKAAIEICYRRFSSQPVAKECEQSLRMMQ